MNDNRIRNIAYLFLVFGVLMTFSSCTADESKSVLGFFAGLAVFMVGTIFTGIPAIILSVVSISSKKTSTFVLAIILTILSGVFCIVEISIFSSSSADLSGSAMIFPIITAGITILSAVFIMMGFNKRKKGFINNADQKMDVLDDLSNSKEDELI